MSAQYDEKDASDFLREPEDYDVDVMDDHAGAGYYDDDDESDVYSYDVEAEWEESKAQMQALFSLVLFPVIGRWMGRKFSFWLWARWCRSPRTFDSSSFLTMQWLGAMKRIGQ